MIWLYNIFVRSLVSTISVKYTLIYMLFIQLFRYLYPCFLLIDLVKYVIVIFFSWSSNGNVIIKINVAWFFESHNCSWPLAATGYAYPHTWCLNNEAWLCFLCWSVDPFGGYSFLCLKIFTHKDSWILTRLLNMALGHLPFTEKQVITTTGKLMLM